MDQTTILRGHDLFQSLSAEDTAALAERASRKNCRRGEIIYRADSPVSHVFICLEGKIALEVPDGVVDTVAKGQLFGVAALIDASRYPTTARALVPATVLAIEAKLLRQVLQAHSVFGFHVMSRVAQIYYHRFVQGRVDAVVAPRIAAAAP